METWSISIGDLFLFSLPQHFDMSPVEITTCSPCVDKRTRIALWRIPWRIHLFPKSCPGAEALTFPSVPAWGTPGLESHTSLSAGALPDQKRALGHLFLSTTPGEQQFFGSKLRLHGKFPFPPQNNRKKKFKKKKSPKIRLLSPLFHGRGRFPLARFHGPRLGCLPKTPVCFPDRKYESK